MQASLEANFFSRRSAEYLASEAGQQDLAAHLTGRLLDDRHKIVPWLDDSKSLRGAKILEIGCGTGASTVALAEQGADVVSVDIDDLALKDVEERCRLHGLRTEILLSNAAEIRENFQGRQFDLIIFYASLEHMTHEERLVALHDAWHLLPTGGQLCVIDTPNRLWYTDTHTSNLPFYHWLPDDLALKYSQFSPRGEFNSAFDEFTEESHTELMRWGRGVSFHEFQLAMPGVDLSSASCAAGFMRNQKRLLWLKWRFSDHYSYERLLRLQQPGIHPGFYQPYLNLILTK